MGKSADFRHLRGLLMFLGCISIPKLPRLTIQTTSEEKKRKKKNQVCSQSPNPLPFPGYWRACEGDHFLNHNLTISKWGYLVTAVYRQYPLHLDCAQGVNDTDHTRWHCCLIFWFIIDLHFLVSMCSLLLTGKQHSGAMRAQLCPRSPCL